MSDASPYDRIRDAVLESGPNPDCHWQQVDRLAREWPTLATALAELLWESGDDVPCAWRGLS